ncbi:MAG: LON peptidase substrate-binding domain-containing protein [Ignavibacteria bacterium]|jgi:Lon protease-like protein|nr:LON peptidase substrate-binding domain-containing protein [Ignavibacteria bacterium]
MNKIPIFILKLVVFPNSYYPLHIFEERYKKLIKSCIEKGLGFGIIDSPLNAENKIGSFVEVQQITKRFDNGEFDIIVKGIERFTVNNINLSSDGYYEAYVEPFYDESEYAQPLLIERTVFQFKEILSSIKYDIGESFWDNFLAANLKSFKLAEKTGLSYDDQIELLGMKQEEKRLAFLLQHFNKLKKYLNDKAVIDKIVKNDGYLN